jgi:hypothetical protein
MRPRGSIYRATSELTSGRFECRRCQLIRGGRCFYDSGGAGLELEYSLEMGNQRYVFR